VNLSFTLLLTTTMASHIPSNLVDEIPAPAFVHQHSLPRQPYSYHTSLRPRDHDVTPRPKISLRTAIKSFSSAFIVLGLLIVALVLDIVGMALFMILVPKANEGPFIILCALFILVYVTPPCFHDIVESIPWPRADWQYVHHSRIHFPTINNHLHPPLSTSKTPEFQSSNLANRSTNIQRCLEKRRTAYPLDRDWNGGLEWNVTFVRRGSGG